MNLGLLQNNIPLGPGAGTDAPPVLDEEPPEDFDEFLRTHE